jgi:hypothetical protein
MRFYQSKAGGAFDVGIGNMEIDDAVSIWQWQDELMTTKEKLVHAIEDLPDDATFEDAMERMLFLAKVERGIQQADAGQTVSHAQVRERMAKWLK